jgi:GT2 family glycosyltransferase
MGNQKVTFGISLGVVIGTFQRPDQLERTLAALSRSSKRPSFVCVVDSSGGDFASRTELACDQASELGIAVTYLRTETKSLTVQKNKGIQRLLELGVDFIQVIDDDTIPRENFLEILLSYLLEHPEVSGVSGVAPVEGFKNSARLVRLPFVAAGLDSFRPGSVSTAGVGIPVNCSQVSPTRTEWLIGCSMWRASVFHAEVFDETLRGSSLFEDVDFSVRARRLGYLVVLCSAVLDHEMSPDFRPDLALHHYRFSRNRWIVLRSLRAGPLRYFSFFLSVVFMEVYLALKWVTLPNERQEYWGAMKQNLLGYLDGLKSNPPK